MRALHRIATALFLFAAIPHSGTASTGTVISDRAAARLLDQATWGPTPASIAALQQSGFTSWLNSQFAAPASSIPSQAIINSLGNQNRDMHPVQLAFFQNALTGNDQLRQRVAFALTQIWVVSAVDVTQAYAFPPYWQILSSNAFGNYRDLIKAMTLSPAMGRFLNMANNNKAASSNASAPNENYGRELLQLFTIGLNQLNPDGSPVLDSKGNPVPNYTQAEITDMARVLTGWTYPTAPGMKQSANNPIYFLGSMFAVESNHDTGAKTVFGGIQIPAGQTAEQDLDTLINELMQQPSMAPFVSKQLIQHLVTSNPSPEYISRVSAVFNNDGTGVKGNLKAVVQAILLDPEARAGDSPNLPVNPAFGHLREPVLLVLNVLRGLNGTLGPNSIPFVPATNMGQNLFSPTDVFGYFSPQYQAASGELAPEFQIYDTASAAVRANFINTILYGSMDSSTKVNLAPFQNFKGNNAALADYISQVFLYHSMSSNLTQAVVAAANANPTQPWQAALYVALTSGEYQVIH